MVKTKSRESKIYHSYHIPGRPHYNTLKKNAIFVSNANSVRHELSKCIGAIMIKKFGDVKFTKEIIKLIRIIDCEIGKLNLVVNSSNFITEAVPNNEGGRRVDLVCVNTDDRYEFETDHKIKKDNAITIYI